MVISQGIQKKHKEIELDVENEEMISRMASDLRARSDPDFPHSYYVAQVRRQLAGKSLPSNTNRATPTLKPPVAETHSSVFHAWALAE